MVTGLDIWAFICYLNLSDIKGDSKWGAANANATDN